MSIAQRELIVKNGLGDREASVRSAAGELIGVWVDCVGGRTSKSALSKTGDAQKKKPVAAPKPEENTNDDDAVSSLVGLLGMLDLGESTVASDALLSVFETRPEVFDDVKFGGGLPSSPPS